MISTQELFGKELSFGSVDDRDILYLISRVRQGLEYSLFESILNTGPFSFDEWSSYLNLSERTLQRYRKEQKSFQINSSERILEILLLYQYALTVFEDEENLNIWLNSKNVALGGIKPKELLDTTFGITLVRDELTRIEHGVFA